MKKNIVLFLTVLAFISCKNQPLHLIKVTGEQIAVSEKIITKKSIDSFVKPYREKVSKEMNSTLSYTPKDLTRTDGALESSLGNLMADLCYQKANAIFNARTGKNIDFSLFNYGGIRAGISKGIITKQHAFKLMPFENTLVVVALSGEKITELVTYLQNQKLAHPVSKHFNLILKKGSYHLKINNKNFDLTKTYYVLTSDYLQHGGDKMNFFKNPIKLYKTNYKVRNAIIDYFTETDTIKVMLDGRISYKK